MDTPEWRILKDVESNVQKILNQWRHTYKLQIYAVNYDSQSKEIIITLTRERR